MKVKVSHPFPLVAGLLVTATILSGCVTTTESELDVRLTGRFVYDTGTEETITASYHTLSDDSLNFVKLVLPDGEEHTLPQVVSASGARYSDDRALVWWVKGETARLETRGDGGEWVARYGECRVVK